MSSEIYIHTDLSERDQIRNQIEKHSLRVEQLVQYARDYDVCSKWAAEEALTVATNARDLFKKIEAARKEIIEPARKFTNKVNDTAKIFTEKLQEVEQIIKSKIDNWKSQERREKEAREEEARLLAASLNVEILPFVEETPKYIKTEGATSYEKTVWKFDVTDLKQVPLEFLMINDKLVEGCIRSGMREIPGLKIYSEQKTIIVSR